MPRLADLAPLCPWSPDKWPRAQSPALPGTSERLSFLSFSFFFFSLAEIRLRFPSQSRRQKANGLLCLSRLFLPNISAAARVRGAGALELPEAAGWRERGTAPPSRVVQAAICPLLAQSKDQAGRKFTFQVVGCTLKLLSFLDKLMSNLINKIRE